MNLKQITTCFVSAVIASSPIAASAQSYLSFADKEYLMGVNEYLDSNNNPLRLTVSDSDKIAIGVYTCEQLDNGKTFDSIRNESIDTALTVEEGTPRTQVVQLFATLHVYSIHKYCPQHLQQLEAQ